MNTEHEGRTYFNNTSPIDRATASPPGTTRWGPIGTSLGGEMHMHPGSMRVFCCTLPPAATIRACSTSSSGLWSRVTCDGGERGA